MSKIFFFIIFVFARINCISQDTIKVNIIDINNDPKTMMWEKTRAQNTNNASNAEVSNNKKADPKNDSKTQQWEKVRQESINKNMDAKSNSPDPNADPKTIMWKKQREESGIKDK